MSMRHAVGHTLAGVSLFLGLGAGICAQSANVHKQTPAATSQSASAKVHNAGSTATQDDNGDIVYAQNCSRCHDAPESLNHRITGTVLLHMRTRANLSEADERALLKFFTEQ